MTLSLSVILFFCYTNVISIEQTTPPRLIVQIDSTILSKKDSIKREKRKQAAIIQYQQRFGCTEPDKQKIAAANRLKKNLIKRK